MAPSEGFAGKTFVNQGELSNEGIELLLEGRVLERPNLAWDLSLNISHNDNKVVNLGGDSEISLSFNTQHVPGYPPASWWMRRIVEAEFIAVTDDPDGRQSRLATSWMCDSGPENDNRPVPCDEAPRVFFGPNLPTTEGAVSSDLLLWNRLRLHALVDFKLGQWVQSGDVRGRCSVRQICIDNHLAIPPRTRLYWHLCKITPSCRTMRFSPLPLRSCARLPSAMRSPTVGQPGRARTVRQ